ncbi:hypothetical protein LCGC14_2938890 [marine sediment metagenome]|uniref:Uncharacterized protein n=1 Tax=marine sediment metagenome TaxID=412755 RepID=A0A0F8XJ97_9ZZZZ
MANISIDDLLKKLDEQSVNLGRLALQKDALERENEALKQTLVPAPSRAERRRKKEK